MNNNGKNKVNNIIGHGYVFAIIGNNEKMKITESFDYYTDPQIEIRKILIPGSTHVEFYYEDSFGGNNKHNYTNNSCDIDTVETIDHKNKLIDISKVRSFKIYKIKVTSPTYATPTMCLFILLLIAIISLLSLMMYQNLSYEPSKIS